jgi:hypothetical protein
MQVTYPGEIWAEPQVFMVNVTGGGQPLSGAEVCLYKTDDIYSLEETDAEGNAEIIIDPAASGTMLVTVTKREFLPHLGEAIVQTDVTPPSVPRNLVTEETAGARVRVTWSRCSDTDLCWYELYRNTAPVPESLAVVSCGDTTYTDTTVIVGNAYYYWVTGIDSSGNESDFSDSSFVSVDGQVSIPQGEFEEITGIVVRPNPFSSSVSLVFPAPRISGVMIEVYDIAGRKIRELPPQRIDERRCAAQWNGEDASGRTVSSGIYIIRVSAGSASKTQKLIRLR